jgi:dethiobiotin synthetase
VVAAALCAALVERGEQVAAFKPVITGLDDFDEGAAAADEPTHAAPDVWPPDDVLLATAAGGWQSREQVAPYRFGPPLSPHFAAELAGATIEPAQIVAAARAAADERTLIAEGVGGLLVPITPGYLVRDLAIDLALPLVVAARTWLGTINHTLLTVESARTAGLTVAGIVMTPWPTEPEAIESSNRATVERLTGVAVAGLPPTSPDALADAGSHLPIAEWLPWSQ